MLRHYESIPYSILQRTFLTVLIMQQRFFCELLYQHETRVPDELLPTSTHPHIVSPVHVHNAYASPPNCFAKRPALAPYRTNDRDNNVERNFAVHSDHHH